MAKRFLTDINLTGNQIIQASLEKLATDPVADLFEGRMYYNTAVDKIKYYNGTAWVVIGEAGDIALGTNTSGNYVADLTAGTGISVSGGNQETANITVSNTDRGSSQNIFKNISDGATSVVADNNDDTVIFTGSTGISVSANATTDTLTITNTDTGSAQNIFKNIAVSGQNTVVAESNDDTLTLAGSGITITTNDTTDTVTFTNAGVTSIAGTTNEVEVSASTGSVTIGLPNDVTIGNSLTVTGDLTVNGTTTTLNTTELLVEDNIITLNSGVTGTPALNAGIEIERGTSANVSIRWNESTDTWELTRDGTNYEEITTVGTITSGDISDFAEAAQDAVGGILATTGLVPFTYDDGLGTISADITLAGTSYLSKTGNALAVDITSVETKLVTDGFAKKVSASVGNGTNTSFAVTHNLGTRDVQVQVFDNATYDTVECDVVRTDTNNVTVSFATAPASNAYRVVVIG